MHQDKAVHPQVLAEAKYPIVKKYMWYAVDETDGNGYKTYLLCMPFVVLSTLAYASHLIHFLTVQKQNRRAINMVVWFSIVGLLNTTALANMYLRYFGMFLSIY